MLPQVTRKLIHESVLSHIYLEIPEGGSTPSGIRKLLKDEKVDSKHIAQFNNEYVFTQKLPIGGVRKALKQEMLDGRHSLLLEYVDGITLKEAFVGKQRPLADFLQVAISVANTLQQLHDHNIIHKDINPNNILCHPGTLVTTIIDFNISSEFSLKTQHLGNPQMLEGTLPYLSPEQSGRMNRVVDYRTDLYSLGATFYELLTGKPPFESRDTVELIHMHLAQAPTPPDGLVPGLPGILSAIVLKLLAKNAEDRYQSAYGLGHDLQRCLNDWQSTGQIAPFLLGEKDFSVRFCLSEKLYGREQESAQLMNEFNRAALGKLRMVLVSGVSGSGKSTLINELHRPITKAQGYFLAGKFDQLQRDKPYYALAQAFEAFCDILFTENELVLKRWEQQIKTAAGANGAVLTGIVSALERVIGKQPPLAEVGGANEAQNRLGVVFRDFMRAIAQPDHPLVLFIDDMQWADAASLKLLQLLLTDDQLGHVLFIFSFRENEVDAAHPFALLLGEVAKQGVEATAIKLGNLSQAAVHQLIADTLKTNDERIGPLAELVMQKTLGNAFFANQFIKSLYEEKLLTFQYQEYRWQWNLAAIGQMGFSSNVVELMTAKVRKLPAETQRLLQYAACIGNTFNIQHLATVAEKNLTEVTEQLRPALVESLLIVNDEDFREVEAGTSSKAVHLHFAHDRIQQACYQMMDGEQAKQTHLQIARLLFGQASEANLHDEVFDIVNQYNQGISLVDKADEKIRVATLNLAASKKAKAASANASALRYARTGMSLLGESHWQSDYALCFGLYLERAEIAHFCQQDQEAEQHFDTAIGKARSLADKALAYEKKIHFYTNLGKFREAYFTGQKVLREDFGVKLPTTPAKPVLIANMLRTRFRLRNVVVEQLADYRTATDERTLLAVKLIGAILKSAYQIRPEMAVGSGIVMVNLCLDNGNTPDAAVGYLVFGSIFLGGILGFRQTGHEFGKLALALVDKYQNKAQKSEVIFVFGYFANSWLLPLTQAEEYFKQAYTAGLEVGDFFHVGCSCAAMLQHQLMRGASLAEIEQQADAYYRLLAPTGNNETAGTVQAIGLVAKGLLSGKPTDLMQLPDTDEQQLAAQLDAYVSKHFAHYYFINKMMSLWLAGNYAQGLEIAAQSAKYLDASTGMLHSTEHYFYQGLLAAGMAETSSDAKFAKVLKSCISKFKAWQKHNPFNFGAKLLLLEGLWHSLQTGEQAQAKAIQTLLKAKESAKSTGFRHLVAFAAECVGKLLKRQGLENEAQVHLQNALQQYALWGATAKTAQLRSTYQLADNTGTFSNSVRGTSFLTASYSNSSSTSSMIDAQTLVRSSNTLAEEVVLSSLLEKVMQMVIENAGAEYGLLLLKDKENGQWYLEGQIHGQSGKVQVLSHIPQNEADLPQSLIMYVLRTQTPVLLDDATQEGNFTADDYMLTHRPKSVLCVPLLRNGETTGVLYLENNLATAAFTKERIEILNLLTSQMAISIENAYVYDKLEGIVNERTREVIKQKEIIEKKNEDITSSITYAKRIQSAMLPSLAAIRERMPETFILYKPRDIVSGDFYWHAYHQDKNIIAAIDCTGHGVPGAFMSLIGDAYLDQIVGAQNITDPGHILSQLNLSISHALKQDETNNQDGMDAALCTIDVRQGTIAFAGANNSLLIVDAHGELTEIKADKMGIGGKNKEANTMFSTKQVALQPGSMYYLFTDGYADQFGGPQGRKMMVKNFKKTLAEIAHLPVEAQSQYLEQHFDAWKGNEKQLDDVLVIGFRII